MTTESILLNENHDGVVTLTLNRPAQFNALSTRVNLFWCQLVELSCVSSNERRSG
ncbi:MAG: hypothetical protein Q8L93_02525 [Rhodocyclaceae bacterium]|nr:hypothetical protein [Rhodocyclaceae bacterium]